MFLEGIKGTVSSGRNTRHSVLILGDCSILFAKVPDEEQKQELRILIINN